MIENPYEAPLAAEPLQARTQYRAFKFLGPIEYLIVFGNVAIIAAVACYRLNWQIQWIPPDRTKSVMEFSLFAGMALVTVTGLRGLFCVMRRNRIGTIVNGLLCVLGFFVFLGAVFLVVEKLARISHRA